LPDLYKSLVVICRKAFLHITARLISGYEFKNMI